MAAFLRCLYDVLYSFHEHTDSIIRAALSRPQLNLITSLSSHPQNTIMWAFRASAYDLRELEHSVCQNGLFEMYAEGDFWKV